MSIIQYDTDLKLNAEALLPALTYTPFGTILVLDYHPVEKVGAIILPNGVKQPLEFVTCKVLSAGPKTEQAKAGTTILIAVKAIMSVKHDGRTIFITQENTIIGLVDGL